MRGPLTDEQCDDVKKSVIEMFEECGIDSYPIDPYLIAERLCYVLRRYSDLSFEKQVEAANCATDRTVLRSKTDAERSERTP